jgi:hypothetical protein
MTPPFSDHHSKGSVMQPSRKEREPVMGWNLKLTAMIDQALPADVSDPRKETEALHMALLEMAIAGLMSQTDQADAMTVINQTMYDLFDAQLNDHHWRHKENSEMAAIYKKVRREFQ